MLEVPNGRRIELKGEVPALAFSADGSFPAATTIYSPVQIWDLASGIGTNAIKSADHAKRDGAGGRTAGRQFKNH